MTGACVQCIVLWIILSAYFGINDAAFCGSNVNYEETPYVQMCTEDSRIVQPGDSLFIDSTFAPILQKVSCNCTITLPQTGNIELSYRVHQPTAGCKVSFRFNGDNSNTWGCFNYTHAYQIQPTGRNLTYIKNDNIIQNWDSCTKITALAGLTLNVTCFPSRIYYAPEDNVNGGWGAWSDWTDCSVTCNGGTKTRTRECNNPPPQNNGTLCSGEKTESSTCNDVSCSSPVNGQYSEWTQWSDCTTSCGGGTQTRSRQCNNPAPQNGGSDCSDDANASMTCNTQPCPVEGQYSTWGTWSTCSQTCGDGTRTRSRICDNPVPQHGGQPCMGNINETQTCTIRYCPVDGQYSEWGKWGTCSQTCGQGTRTRSRSCTNPAPQYDGQPCSGQGNQTQTCTTQTCPVDGAWSSWLTWTDCSITCGNGGYRTRSRTCNNPEPANGGTECVGDSSDTETCTKGSCAVDGNWGQWSAFSACSVTCEYGQKTRTRLCNTPSPSNGGRNCEGNSDEASTCYNNPCPVNGSWGPWSPWSACSATCDNGLVSRTRNCNNPSPSNGGSSCSGSNNQSNSCSVTPCPVSGQWGPWSPWNDCAVTCGESVVKRQRYCNNPTPDPGGAPCIGNAAAAKQCLANMTCPVDGGVGPWSPWSTCSVTCSTGTKSRSRFCNNPSPANGGRNCTKALNENVDCYTNCTGSGGSTASSSSTESTGDGNEQAGAQREIKTSSANIGALVGGIIGGLLFVFLVVLLLICFLRRRKKEPETKTGPRSVRYMSGDDVTVTENELYNYDGETPAHATNALFVGGIPETPTSPGYIPHFSTDTGDRYAVIMDSTRRKQNVKKRPSLQTFDSTEKDTAKTNGDIRASTDTVKLAENYNEDIPGDGVENPGYDGTYLAPYDSPTEQKPKTSSSSSPSPYDYIDHAKLKQDDEEYERENAANDYATLPDERDEAESEYNGRYKRFINKDPSDDASDGYLKSPTRDKTFEYPVLN